MEPMSTFETIEATVLLTTALDRGHYAIAELLAQRGAEFTFEDGLAVLLWKFHEFFGDDF